MSMVSCACWQLLAALQYVRQAAAHPLDSMALVGDVTGLWQEAWLNLLGPTVRLHTMQLQQQRDRWYVSLLKMQASARLF